MRRINIIFIVLSLNCLSGYFLDYPLIISIFHPIIEKINWDPLSKYLLVAIPLIIAFPIIIGDSIYQICIILRKFLNPKDITKAKMFCDKFVDSIVLFCVIIILIWSIFLPNAKSFAFDKRSYVFDQMYRRHRGIPIYESDDCGKFQEITNFKGIILQNAGADGIWNTSDDIIRLERERD